MMGQKYGEDMLDQMITMCVAFQNHFNIYDPYKILSMPAAQFDLICEKTHELTEASKVQGSKGLGRKGGFGRG